LKGAASKWFIGVSENIEPGERTLEFITMRLRKKYGRRETGWQTQERLRKRVQQPGERDDAFADSLVNIGFGRRVPAESFIDAFLDGLNNQIAAAQMRSWSLTTLEEAVQAVIETWGEFAEGRKVTEWREASRLYRRGPQQDENDTAKRNVEPKKEPVPQIDWAKLGLGLGGSKNDDAAPRYDNSGKAVGGIATSGRMQPEGALPLAALQAIAFAAGAGQVAATQKTAPTTGTGKPKVGRALEVKSEATAEVPTMFASGREHEGGTQSGRQDYYGGGRGNYGGGRGYYGVAVATMVAGRATTAVAMVATEEASGAAEATSKADNSAVVEAEVHLDLRTVVRDTIVRPADGRSDSRRPIRSAGTAGKWATGGASARCEPLTCKDTLNLRRPDLAQAAATGHRRPPRPNQRQERQLEQRRETRRGSRGRGSAARGGSIPYASDKNRGGAGWKPLRDSRCPFQTW
jgi:hypothetical protein